MANETISSLPAVASPNATDLVPIEHGASGGPYTTSQTTIAELVAAGASSSGTPVTFSSTAASNGFYPSTSTVTAAVGETLRIRAFASIGSADTGGGGLIAVTLANGNGVAVIAQADGNAVIYECSGTNLKSTVIVASGNGNHEFNGIANGQIELLVVFGGSAGTFVSATINGLPIIAVYGNNSGFTNPPLIAADLTSGPLTIYTDTASNPCAYKLANATSF